MPPPWEVCLVYRGQSNKYISGDIVDIEQVYQDAGETEEGDPRRITRAAESINKKTRKTFGFAILSTPKGALQLQLTEKTPKES